MADNPRTEILTGIYEYLRQHFPETEFLEQTDARTGSVFLNGLGQPSHRLEVTEQFLVGEDSAAPLLRWVREWNLARALREAKGRLVHLATTGITIEP